LEINKLMGATFINNNNQNISNLKATGKAINEILSNVPAERAKPLTINISELQIIGVFIIFLRNF